jgi:hypothetical protein
MSAFQLESLTYQTEAVTGSIAQVKGCRFATPDLGEHLTCEKNSDIECVDKLGSAATHPPHVLVSAKVLLQSRRAKGGFSFGDQACHG